MKVIKKVRKKTQRAQKKYAIQRTTKAITMSTLASCNTLVAKRDGLIRQLQSAQHGAEATTVKCN